METHLSDLRTNAGISETHWDQAQVGHSPELFGIVETLGHIVDRRNFKALMLLVAEYA